MKSARTPAILLVLLYAALAADLLLSASHLPDRVATHFGAEGNPNGWMTRREHLVFMGIFSAAVPLFIIGIFYSIRFMPTSLVNIPNRDYWLAPERKADSVKRLFPFSLWLADILVIFLAATHHLIVRANAMAQPHLDGALGLGALAMFVAGIIAWLIGLLRQFRLPDKRCG